MKFATALLLLTCAFQAAHAASPLRAQRLWALGQEYYRLDHWAERNGFKLTWTGKTDVVLSKPSVRMAFSGDSRRMEFNGTVIILSHQVVAKNGVAYITPVDVNTTLNPLLWPPRLPPKQQIKHICLDPGHGGRDVGQRSGAEYEKKYTLLLANELAQQLRKAGYTVSLTRSADTALDLSARTDVARRRGADLFISLHFNSSGLGGRNVKGVETYCLTPARAHSTNDPQRRGNTSSVSGNRNDAQNMLLAYEVHKAVLRATGGEDRGVKRARFEVLRTASMPAVLVEAAFLSNPTEAKKIMSTAWRRDLATAIVGGIRSYRSQVQK